MEEQKVQTKVKDLQPTSKQVNLLAKVVALGEQKEITPRYGAPRRLVEATIGDETATVILTLWEDQINQIGKDEEELARLDREREEARLAEARRHPSELTQAERLLRVRGISERNIEQMANAGYKTVEDIHNEPDVVKFGEATGLGVKKGKQVKAAVEHYLQEEARLKADLDAQRAAQGAATSPQAG